MAGPWRNSDERMTIERTTIIYVAGSGRSGSTLLANVLGSAAGAVSAGEIRYLWERGVLENRLCGCGLRFGECPRWADVRAEVGSLDHATATSVVRMFRQATRLRHVPRIVASRWWRDTSVHRLDWLPDHLARVYAAISHTAGGAVVVDSSKLPAYGFLLSQLPHVDLFVVHLVRDPRAAAASWLSRKEQPDRGTSGLMEQKSVLSSSVLWSAWNWTAGALWNQSERYALVRYEDFIARPRHVAAGLVAAVGLDGGSLPFLDESTVELPVSHTVAGNPDRLTSGPVTIRDRGSRGAADGSLAWAERAVVTAVTLPLLGRFGYTMRECARPARTSSGLLASPVTRTEGDPRGS